MGSGGTMRVDSPRFAAKYEERRRGKLRLKAAKVLQGLRSVRLPDLTPGRRDEAIEDLQRALRDENYHLVEALLVSSPYNWFA